MQKMVYATVQAQRHAHVLLIKETRIYAGSLHKNERVYSTVNRVKGVYTTLQEN